MVYNVPPEETEPVMTSHINGTTEEILARYCVTELCKGWPVYRDASEWKNYRSLFAKEGAYVWTTWSGGLPIEKFIEVSIKGRANGDFIMHRENGTLANVNLATQRGLGKMKATITQRFTIQGIAVDVECDCRFIFFCKIEEGAWKAQYVKLFYEKDRVVPVDGKTVPHFPKEELDKYTEGYQYLAAAQNSLGHPILNDLPNAGNQGFFDMYKAMADWLQGQEINLFWEKK
ncbi:uncharacterized protein A1O5_02574 [Cladophialophora psammophila CBS 110553]|uniref:SnoaL-like domain-containing protein n=1 Tax=Cladophialophora psammophila CBS 110553 TaxID=1182543 RepID=W9X260_9EURO|nr:uncharacterized protein A1O5_02574 [Cladophialophora psammophila CBS 110553]EXJ74278.1 hypothetical protein A1O5_02574 [Cladophialophora psammophila CBS 110553]